MRNNKNHVRRDVYAEVTAKILAELEKGVAPWVKPWTTTRGGNLPKNAISERFYNGSNVVLLWITAMEHGWPHRWLTFNQAKAVGGHIRKDEHGTMIVFGSKFTVEDRDTGEDKIVPFLKHWTVFNVTQCEDLPDDVRIGEVVAPRTIEERDTEAEAFVKATGAKIVEGGETACYIPSKDFIRMPEFNTFEGADHFYGTELHELGHWTGHESRLNRDLKTGFGTKDYAAEELVAELTSAFLAAELGFTGKLRHAEYIGHWITMLKDDSRAFVKAAAKAQKAADFLRGVKADAEDVPEKRAA